MANSELYFEEVDGVRMQVLYEWEHSTKTPAPHLKIFLHGEEIVVQSRDANARMVTVRMPRDQIGRIVRNLATR